MHNCRVNLVRSWTVYSTTSRVVAKYMYRPICPDLTKTFWNLVCWYCCWDLLMRGWTGRLCISLATNNRLASWWTHYGLVVVVSSLRLLSRLGWWNNYHSSACHCDRLKRKGSGLNCDPDTGAWVLYNTGRILVNNTRDPESHIYNTGSQNTGNSSIVEY